MLKINSNTFCLEELNFKSKKVPQNAYQVARSGHLERVPQKDKIEKKDKRGRTVALATLGTVSLAALIEVFAFKGKHVNKLVTKVKNKFGKKVQPEPKPNPVKPEVKPVEPKPTEVKPEVKPAELKPTEVKPEVKPVEPKPTEVKPEVKPEVETKIIDGQQVRVEKAEPPKLLQGIDRSQYPKKYVQDGLEVKEELMTSSFNGDEYIFKNFYQNGNLVKKEYSQHGSTLKATEHLYKDGVKEKTIYYKEDGVTKSWEQIYDSTGKEIESRHYDEKGLNIIRVKKPEAPKLLQGIDRSQYPKKYVQDGLEVKEELMTSSFDGDEYISKKFYQNGNLVKKEYSQHGSTLKATEHLYKDDVEEKIIYYKKDGVTKWFERVFDSNGKEIETRHYN